MFPNIRTQHRRVSTMDAEEKSNRKNFYWGFTIAVSLALALFILVIGWALDYGGGIQLFGTKPGLLGIHMTFAVFFILILNAFSSLLYRALPKVKKSTAKLIHAGVHFLVFIGSIVAFAAAIDMHNKDNPPKHFFSLHSWLSLATLCIYYSQFLGGVILFLLKISTSSFRTFAIPYHKVIGQIVLYFACGAVLTGLYNAAPSSANAPAIPTSGIDLNIGALLTVAFTFTVVYLLTSNNFRRPIFEEVEPLLVDPPPPPQMREYYQQQTFYGAGTSTGK